MAGPLPGEVPMWTESAAERLGRRRAEREEARRELQASIDDLRARELHAKLTTIEGQVCLLAESLEADATTARDANSLAEHDLLQIALTQLDEVRKTVERARKARSGE